jgi:hypothetical protein
MLLSVCPTPLSLGNNPFRGFLDCSYAERRSKTNWVNDATCIEQTPKNFKSTGKQVYPILYTKKIFVRTGYVTLISERIDTNRNGIHLMTTRSVYAEIHTKQTH